jgi:hypothetical protein
MDVETLAQTESREAAFHADDLEQIASYGTLSGLAIVSLVFGLAAPLSFLFPLLIVIPLVGAVVSLVALRRIATSEGTLVGRPAAMIGLVLCVLAGAATISRVQVTRYLHVRQAAEFARQWIELLTSGQLENAFKLTVPGSRPEPPSAPGEPPPVQTPFEQFVNNTLVQRLTAGVTNADVRLAETVSYEPQSGKQCFVRQRFTIIPRSPAEGRGPAASEPIDALLTLQRSRLAGETLLRWRVAGYDEG